MKTTKQHVVELRQKKKSAQNSLPSEKAFKLNRNEDTCKGFAVIRSALQELRKKKKLARKKSGYSHLQK